MAYLVTSGCLPGILSGKKYAKALFCLDAVNETLERQLFHAYVEQVTQEFPVKFAELWSIEALVQLISMHGRVHLLIVVQNNDLKEIVRDFLTFKSSVPDGTLWLTMPGKSSCSSMPWKQTMLAYTTNSWQIWHLCSSLKGGGGGAKLCTIPEMVWNFPHQHWSESSWCISVAELLNSVVRSMKPGCAAGSKLTQQWKNLSWNLQNLGAVSYTVYKRESMIKNFMSKHGNFMNILTCMQATKNGNKNALCLKILKMSCCYSLSCWCRRHWTPSELLSISKALLVWMSKISQSNSRNVWTVQWITNHSSWVIKYSHAK